MHIVCFKLSATCLCSSPLVCWTSSSSKNQRGLQCVGNGPAVDGRSGALTDVRMTPGPRFLNETAAVLESRMQDLQLRSTDGHATCRTEATSADIAVAVAPYHDLALLHLAQRRGSLHPNLFECVEGPIASLQHFLLAEVERELL